MKSRIQFKLMMLLGVIGLSAVSPLWGGIFGQEIGGDNFKIAQKAVDPAYQNKLFWIKAEGPVSSLNRWAFYFYDPTSTKDAKMVIVVNGRLDEVKSKEFKPKSNDSFIFDPSQSKVSTEQALQRASEYASQHGKSFDSVKMELRRFSSNVMPTWQIRLYANSHYVGVLNLNDVDGTVVSYSSEKPASGKANDFFHDVETTFKGIGADLEEFFTGDRTVDK
ncbi:MAG: hypothetical protein V4507_06575 [Verrucomicrobiota bacterium]